jgi:protein-disulfide isomerase
MTFLTLPVGSRDHVRGPADAAVTVVVEYADVECPYCRRLHPVLRDVLAQRPGVRLVYRHFPSCRSTRTPTPPHWPWKPRPDTAGSGSCTTGFQSGVDSGVQGTPGLFVNELRLLRVPTLAQLLDAVDRAATP